jgi:hypothetical protein
MVWIPANNTIFITETVSTLRLNPALVGISQMPSVDLGSECVQRRTLGKLAACLLAKAFNNCTPHNSLILKGRGTPTLA